MKLHTIWFAAMLSGLAVASAPTAAKSATILVLDGSGSMWGQVDGRSKMDIAHDAIRTLVSGRNPAAELGLTVYGHRREADCKDIESLVPLAPNNSDALLRAIESLTPKGKTPIGSAVTQAAIELDYEQRPATVILVSDGRETCDVDPCAVAARLEERGVDFTAHVIGFDLAQNEDVELRCLAKATGGLFVRADDAVGLERAVRTLFEEASLTPEPGIWLAAVLAEDRQPIDEPVHWKIFRTHANEQIETEPVHRAESATQSIKLPTGSYRVEATHRGVSGRLDIEVDDRARARHVVVLGAARLEVVASYERGDEQVYSDIAWRLAALDAEQRGKIVRTSESPAEVFVVPGGRYELRVRHRDWTIQRKITLLEGQVAREHVRFGEGKLALQAALSSGSLPIRHPIQWKVVPVDLDSESAAEKNREQLRPTCLFALASGRYRVTVTYGATSTSRDVEVRAGVTTTTTLNLRAGEARVFASLPAPGGSINDPVEWTVASFTPGGRPNTVATKRSASHSFILPAGRYRVSGTLDRLRGDGIIEITPGESRSLSVVLR
ncbi:MAG: VWA domain-containing protein [bacterium]|nr:VWA domain-containing protein [bacterium]